VRMLTMLKIRGDALAIFSPFPLRLDCLDLCAAAIAQYGGFGAAEAFFRHN